MTIQSLINRLMGYIRDYTVIVIDEGKNRYTIKEFQVARESKVVYMMIERNERGE